MDFVKILVSDLLEPAEKILVRFIHDSGFGKIWLIFDDLVGNWGGGKNSVIIGVLKII